MNFRRFLPILLSTLCVFLVGCEPASKHAKSLHSSAEREMTLGVVQRDIKTGMTQAEVAEALGSPNIVTQDSNGNETWIYDKIASEISYSRDSGGIGVGVGGYVENWGIVPAGGISYGKSAGAIAQTQKTLTVVIKFDENKRLKTLSYHSSKF